jgi:hypothetical protein
MTKTLSKTLDELRPYIDALVERKVSEILADPELSRPLSKKLSSRLTKAPKRSEMQSLTQVRKELGL